MSTRFGSVKIAQARGGREANWPAGLCIGLLAVMMSSCDHPETRVVMTKPITHDTETTHVYVCQIHSCRHKEIRAKTRGYLEVVNGRAGRLIKEGDEMFRILSHAPGAAAKSLEAKYTSINAPFNGRTNRLRMQGGSLVREGDLLTTLSDNSEMWVDFNMPEAQYEECSKSMPKEEVKEVQLMLANGTMFDQTGHVNFINAEAGSNNGGISLRAVFPNPKDLLRNGGSGSIRMQNTIKNALLVPRKSTFELLDHHYIYVVDKDGVIRRRQITISQELEDFFRVADGVAENDTIIYEGMQQVHDGEKAEGFVFEEPAKAYAHLSFAAR